MPRKRDKPTNDYFDEEDILMRPKPKEPPSITSVAMAIPSVITSFDTSMVKQAQEKPDWRLYRVEIRDNIPYIVREMCDRCGKVWIPPRNRRLREYKHKELGSIFLETGICKDCINASVYVDKYLDGDALTEKEAKALFYKYAEQYERAWRVVIAAAPREAMTSDEWKHRCNFFGGCAMCGGKIEVQAKYFPMQFNGTHSAWNVIPLCSSCFKLHYSGRMDIHGKQNRYRIFSSPSQFQKTKTIRMYLLHQMEKHDIYMMPLDEWRKRFFEIKTLEGSD